MIEMVINCIGRNEVAIANKILDRIGEDHCIEALMEDIARRINRIEKYEREHPNCTCCTICKTNIRDEVVDFFFSIDADELFFDEIDFLTHIRSTIYKCIRRAKWFKARELKKMVSREAFKEED